MKKLVMASAVGLAFSMIAVVAYAAPRDGGGHFDRMDSNGDGKVTAEELSERQMEFIAEADSDGDGALTKDELKAFRKAQREERRAERNPDANGDGVIDRTEFINAAQERFERMDKNGDGVISKDERPRRGRHGHRRHVD